MRLEIISRTMRYENRENPYYHARICSRCLKDDAERVGEMKINNTAELMAQYMLEHKYNFSFLNASHNKVKLCDPKIIVTGSSHALYGIMESAFSDGCANLSMHSQDIYYDMVNAKHAIQNSNGTIKKCIIVMGYYIIGQDLSKSNNLGHRLIREIYFPLFHDSYHWENPECDMIWENFEMDFKNPATIKDATESILNSILWNGYYNKYHPRKSGIFDWNGRTWKDLTSEERTLAAIQRTSSHNKFIAWEKTIVENHEVLTQFVQYLRENHVQPIVVIMPFTKEYMEHTDPTYKDVVSDMIDNASKKASCPIDFYDLNEYDMWEESDFLDTDHMSADGAEKASKFLNELIK